MSRSQVIPETLSGKRIVNQIRDVLDNVSIPAEQPNKKMIPLSLGDPTTFGNLMTTDIFIKALQKAAASPAAHGYQHTTGSKAAKEAVAKRSAAATGRKVEAADVFLASGCSGALDISLQALASPGDNILLPQPGFALYETLALAHGIEVRHYPLLPHKKWEIDVDALEQLVDDKTRAILVNNPSNPCGSVYSKEHLCDVLAAAERLNLAVIADEIYGNLVFSGETFYSMAELAKNVPVLEVGGLAKEFLVPGLRVGWIIMHDVELEDGQTALQNVRRSALRLTQLTLGANTLVQACMPDILTPKAGSPEERQLAQFNADTIAQLESNAKFVTKRINSMRGLRATTPQGAMYTMVEIDQSQIAMDDVKFTQQLVDEELVFVLPGSCFGMANFVRIVYCAPEEVLAEACDRIEAFLKRLSTAVGN
ncbi:Tyrosine aminotransferase [Hondaea fermentalgiana]|uniref:Tyrosine aminotransferase n=1 Tax=Hondaea fermentalgiana TaxID=2315210 RepID=A0A2R5GIV5_9STRA|nr:Tyrosine aminotransferase [Hondaea fermentalgiana]|eukprot:GBG27804.1 Tyrosine aminotransferase [Hondaea fermentalgiana]